MSDKGKHARGICKNVLPSDEVVGRAEKALDQCIAHQGCT
jgi:hypothetical protein